MTEPALMLTITHRVRAFLSSQGVALAPWSSLDQTYQELYRLLNRRRDDPTFWEPLSQLLTDVVGRLGSTDASSLPAPTVELLESWDVDQLVRELREALPGADVDGSPATLDPFTRRASAPVLGGFLLLGLLASACGGDRTTDVGDGNDGRAGASGGATDETGGAGGTAGASGDAGTGGIQLVETGGKGGTGGTVAIPQWPDDCAVDRDSLLFRAIDQSDLPDQTKIHLCDCFTSLHASWDVALTDLFATGTPDEVAAALEELVECCHWEPGLLENESKDTYRDALLDGSLCHVALPYRGVAFPDE